MTEPPLLSHLDPLAPDLPRFLNMTSVMSSRSNHPQEYSSSYQDSPQPPPPQDRGALELGLNENLAFPQTSLDTLGFLPNPNDAIFGQDGSLPITSVPSNSFDVDFELDLASDAFQSSNAATPAAFGAGGGTGELKFPELPADLLDSSPEYEYVSSSRREAFDMNLKNSKMKASSTKDLESETTFFLLPSPSVPSHSNQRLRRSSRLRWR